MDFDFPEEATIQKNNKIIDEVLKKRVQIVITQFILKEDFKNDCSIRECFITTYHNSTTIWY